MKFTNFGGLGWSWEAVPLAGALFFEVVFFADFFPVVVFIVASSRSLLKGCDNALALGTVLKPRLLVSTAPDGRNLRNGIPKLLWPLDAEPGQ